MKILILFAFLFMFGCTSYSSDNPPSPPTGLSIEVNKNNHIIHHTEDIK
jgi:hypothetical protein